MTGAVKLFYDSINKGVRYVKYLSDGGSKGFKTAIKEKPYDDLVRIEKLECIGHVQKRMGSRLRALKTKMKGQKLDDGKVLSGRVD